MNLTLSWRNVGQNRRGVAEATSLLLFLGVVMRLHGQLIMGVPSCGTDLVHQELLNESSNYAEQSAAFDESWRMQPLMMPSSVLPVYEIPVVVHVLHKGSPVGVAENISDAQIHSAIEALNEDFRKMPGTNGDGLGVDTFIQFKLALRTPEGNPTTGITRLNASGVPGYDSDGVAASPLFDGADQTFLKSLVTWFGQDYVNIFVVTEINGNDGGSGVQGFAYTSPTGDARDGITVLYNAFGTEGTLKPGRELNRTATHEMGHHLSLYHTFWETSECGTEQDCTLEGDRVCDTPPTVENSTCSDPECDNAQVENYLDYSPTSCRNTFTTGQRTRMRFCLETSRNSLLTSLGGVPVVDIDLVALPLQTDVVCQPAWRPTLDVQNQGVQPAPGVQVLWSVNGIPLSPFTHPDTLPAGATASLLLPEVLLPGALTSWTFDVSLPDGSNDEFPENDVLLDSIEYTADDPWRFQLETDFFANEISWEVEDDGGNVVWFGGGYPYGANSYVSQTCMPPGCYTLNLYDSTGDGLAYGGSVLLTRYAGDTLVYIPESQGNFGSVSSHVVCAETPEVYHPGPNPNPCHDFNLNGVCDEDELPGCTYPGAPNFNPEATMDDGSCQEACPGDLNGDGVVQLSDLLSFLVAFGNGCL